MKSIYISVINDLVSDARAHRTCLTLMKSGVPVTLIGRKLRNSPELTKRDYQTKRLKLPVNKGFMFYLLFNLRLFFYLVSRKKNAILVACDLDTLLANYLASVIRNYTLVYDSHEYFTEVPELQNRSIKRKIWLMIEGFILPRLKYAYTVSEAIAHEYNEKYPVKFEVIRNLPLRKKSEILFPLPTHLKSKKKVLYQGAVNIGRGIEQVIEAVKLMDDVVFIIAGEGDLLNDIKTRAEKEHLNDKVFFTGRLPLEKLHELTIQCDLGISLEQDLGKNYRYALPNKIFDYFQAGIPVLISALPEMSRLVNRYGTGIVVDSFEPEYLKDKIEFMLNDEDARRKWKAKLSAAAEELCWEKEEIKLKSFYRTAGLPFPD